MSTMHKKGIIVEFPNYITFVSLCLYIRLKCSPFAFVYKCLLNDIHNLNHLY